MNQIYCVKCRRFTETRDIKQITTKNNTKCFKANALFVERKRASLSRARRKRFFEWHNQHSTIWDAHSGSQLHRTWHKAEKRLNEDMTPKAWSKPINRVDKAAYHHDICYVKNKDTKPRNEVCDKNMLTELNGIYNPTLRERMERGVVSTIIGTKKRFGWGLKKRAQRERQLEFSISWWTS